MSENSPSSAGVVRAMAGSDHWRCVSTPRCRRTSAKVTSVDQRGTNQRRTSSGSASRSVHRNAWGRNSPSTPSPPQNYGRKGPYLAVEAKLRGADGDKAQRRAEQVKAVAKRRRVDVVGSGDVGAASFTSDGNAWLKPWPAPHKAGAAA